MRGRFLNWVKGIWLAFLGKSNLVSEDTFFEGSDEIHTNV